MKKSTIILLILILILAFGIYVVIKPDAKPVQQQNQQNSNNFNIQGMKVEILQQGSGVEAKAGDHVYVHYTGTLENGTKFDSSVDRGTPFDFDLGAGKVIQGWDLGVAGMKVGEKRKLTIPPELGYGDRAVGNIIPANATLLFDVELLKIGN